MAYTIDELAHAAGATVRNVRAYRERGLLPPPRREGRVNLYSEVHVARLRLIGRLLERGYTLNNIAEMLQAFERGEDVSDLLGLETALTSPWSNEVPTYMELSELIGLFGAGVDAATFERAEALGLFRREDARLLVPSPRLLHVGAELSRAGIPLDVLLDQLAALRGDVERIARRFVDLIVAEIFNRYGDDRLPPPDQLPWLAEFIRRVRPMAQTVVDAELAHALEAHVHQVMGDRLSRIAEAMRTASD